MKPDTTPRPDPGPDTVLTRLHETYRTQPQIGLVLGAGVSWDSKIPGYRELALQALRRARHEPSLREPSAAVLAYLERREGEQPDPDQIFEYLRLHFVGDAARFNRLVGAVLYEKLERRSHKMVAADTYLHNSTLDAVVSFCAARPGARHASPRLSPRARVAANKRVAAILTTNYDNLVEGAFGSKYRRSGVVRPVGRPPVTYRPGTIPVYHFHGYISYEPPTRPDAPPKVSDLLIAESDYFGAFYDFLGFGNVVAANFFRTWPTLFIGSSMKDRNIRRILYQTRIESMGAAEEREHFAILLRSANPDDRPREDLEDSVLGAYGVSVIRVDDKSQISALLNGLYLAPDEVAEEEWTWAKRDRDP
jgi:hypothetical protein